MKLPEEAFVIRKGALAAALVRPLLRDGRSLRERMLRGDIIMIIITISV